MGLSELDSQTLVMLNTLWQCSVFTGLDQTSLIEVCRYCDLVHLSKDDILFNTGEQSQGFYVVQTGMISLARKENANKVQILSLYRPYDCFAEASLDRMQTHMGTATALEDSQVILVKRDSFMEFALQHPECALRMISVLSGRMKRFVDHIEDKRFGRFENRLAQYLSDHMTVASDDGKRHVYLDTSKKVLAAHLGVSCETLSRTLAQFKRKGIIGVSKSDIIIKDKEALDGYCN